MYFHLIFISQNETLPITLAFWETVHFNLKGDGDKKITFNWKSNTLFSFPIHLRKNKTTKACLPNS